MEKISIRIIKRQLCFSAVAPSPLSRIWTKQRQTVVTNEEDEKTVETTILKSAYKFLADSK